MQAESLGAGAGTGPLVFQPDGARPGWNLQVHLAGFASPQPYRTPNHFSELSLEEFLTNTLGTAPLVVSFQGARVAGDLGDPCSLSLAGPTASIVPGSLTNWVSHPAELNAFFDDPELAPNVFRFSVIWDRDHPLGNLIEDISQVVVRASAH